MFLHADSFQTKMESHHQQVVVTSNVCFWKTSCSGNVQALHELVCPLVQGLTTVKHGKVTTIQDRSGGCLTEEREILNRWTEYCIELYLMSQRQWRFISTGLSQNRHSRSPPNPSQRSEGCSTVIEEREIGWSRQYLSKTGPSRWRGCNHRSHDNLQ